MMTVLHGFFPVTARGTEPLRIFPAKKDSILIY